jgi:hypothetical protein
VDCRELEKKLDRTSDQDMTSQGTSSQVNNNALVKESVKIAFRERPRVSFWSPKVSAIMHYLKKTVPDFSKSNEVETLLNEALYKLITEEIAKGN